MTASNRHWAASAGHGVIEAPDYASFLDQKRQIDTADGFAPIAMPANLFPFQRSLTEWAIRKGRAALWADCGLGKTAMQLTWADNVVRHTNGRVLLLTPLAVGAQTLAEAEKFGIDARRSHAGELQHGIVVANYERLHHFDPADFVGLVCDESSILKHFSGATQKAVTRFSAKLKYRLLCTATAAPNDYTELGTSSEALGYLGMIDMLSRFFIQKDRVSVRKQIETGQGRGSMVAKTGAEWRLKGHADEWFWRWVCSWARACRMPSDVGFPDDGFVLPDLTEQDHEVQARTLAEGMLFQKVAVGLSEEREERRRTITERCETVARLVDHDRPSVTWCHLNAEGDMLERMVSGARQVCGSMSEDEKEEVLTAFSKGQLQRLIIKPKIGAWGLNWQHCNHVVTFATHSYEQYYQAVRRCWRFGQTRPVTVDIVSAEGESGIRENMKRKADQARRMFASLVEYMNQAQAVARVRGTASVEVPSWLSATK